MQTIYNRGYFNYRIGPVVKWSLNYISIPDWLVDPIAHNWGCQTRYGYHWFGVPTQHIWTIENAQSHFTIPLSSNAQYSAQIESSDYALRVASPVLESVTIRTAESEANVSIYDISGRLVCSGISENYGLQIDASSWSAGVYFAVADHNGELQQSSFIVLEQ
jgi:hypothetical protein